MSGCVGPAVAGTWYPADPRALAAEVDDYLARGPDGAAAAPAALVAPHAGFRYSGPVAALGFRRARPADFDRVLLLGPSHYFRLEGAVLPRAATYRTPLGEVPIDRAAVEALGAAAVVQCRDEPFGPEHSLEAEIPFLQRRLAPEWRLVPVLLGAGIAGDGAARVAEALRPLVGPRTLVVVSSDFTHYGPRFDYVPFTDDVPRGIERLDMGAVEPLLAWDAAGFEDYLARTGATVCGRAALSVLLRLLPAGLAGELAGYDTSGRITGDWSHSVSYASLAFGAGVRP